VTPRIVPFLLRSLPALLAGCAAFAAEPAARKAAAGPRVPADLRIRKDIVF
jgi:hypothetical protein